MSNDICAEKRPRVRGGLTCVADRQARTAWTGGGTADGEEGASAMGASERTVWVARLTVAERGGRLGISVMCSRQLPRRSSAPVSSLCIKGIKGGRGS